MAGGPCTSVSGGCDGKHWALVGGGEAAPFRPALLAPHTSHLVATAQQVFQSFCFITRLLAELSNFLQHFSVSKEGSWVAWLHYGLRGAAGARHCLSNSLRALK